MIEYNCIPFDKDGGISPECDNYAFMHSSAFADVFGKKQRDCDHKEIYGYLKLTKGKRKIYLKYRAWNTVHKGEIMLSYANLCSLKLVGKNVDTTVSVSKSCWFWYCFHNYDSGLKFHLVIAIVALILSIVGLFK